MSVRYNVYCNIKRFDATPETIREVIKREFPEGFTNTDIKTIWQIRTQTACVFAKLERIKYNDVDICLVFEISGKKEADEFVEIMSKRLKKVEDKLKELRKLKENIELIRMGIVEEKTGTKFGIDQII